MSKVIFIYWAQSLKDQSHEGYSGFGYFLPTTALLAASMSSADLARYDSGWMSMTVAYRYRNSSNITIILLVFIIVIGLLR